MWSEIKKRIPGRLRRGLRSIQREFPNRLKDLVPDVIETLRGPTAGVPLPPAHLRRRVAGTTRRREFLRVGEVSFASIRGAFLHSRNATEVYPRWLDFGCGPGRIARHLVTFEPVRELWGLDVDSGAVAWASRHIPGTYRLISPGPPVDLPPNSFDVAYAGSVFTHLSERSQSLWLNELHRLLRPGGLFIASTHGPDLTYSRPDLTREQHSNLQRHGFLFAPADTGRFNDDGAFHSKDYLLATWGKLFGLLFFAEHGLDGYQDLSVWRKW